MGGQDRYDGERRHRAEGRSRHPAEAEREDEAARAKGKKRGRRERQVEVADEAHGKEEQRGEHHSRSRRHAEDAAAERDNGAPLPLTTREERRREKASSSRAWEDEEAQDLARYEVEYNQSYRSEGPAPLPSSQTLHSEKRRRSRHAAEAAPEREMEDQDRRWQPVEDSRANGEPGPQEMTAAEEPEERVSRKQRRSDKDTGRAVDRAAVPAPPPPDEVEEETGGKKRRHSGGRSESRRGREVEEEVSARPEKRKGSKAAGRQEEWEAEPRAEYERDPAHFAPSVDDARHAAVLRTPESVLPYRETPSKDKTRPGDAARPARAHSERRGDVQRGDGARQEHAEGEAQHDDASPWPNAAEDMELKHSTPPKRRARRASEDAGAGGWRRRVTYTILWDRSRLALSYFKLLLFLARFRGCVVKSLTGILAPRCCSVNTRLWFSAPASALQRAWLWER